ncbi:hypothetical protein HQ560_13810 [bacterium]|nr:hypothetical protein [bacterium]
MRTRISRVLAVAFACAQLSIVLPAYADTFTHTKTGRVLQGKLITRTDRDGKTVMFVRLDDGKTAFLHVEEWQVAVTESAREPQRKGPKRPREATGHDAVLATVPLDDLAGVRKAYLELRTEFDAAHGDPGAEDYRKALANLEEQFVKAGDLEAVLAVRKEVKRFGEAQDIPEDALVREPKPLAELQRKYRARHESMAARKRKGRSALTKLYVARLEEMKKHLTTQRRIDDALAVVKEIEHVKAGGDWAAASAPSREGQPAMPEIPLKLAKPCREARIVIRDAMEQMPEPFKNVQEIHLISVHDAAALSRHSGGPQRVKGSFAKQALVGSPRGMLMFGPGEVLGAGDYVITYRLGFLDPVKGSGVCFVDIASSGVTAVGCRPDADRFKPKTWSLIPQLLRNDRERSFHYRFWANGHNVAIDRIYVFRLVRKSE